MGYKEYWKKYYEKNRERLSQKKKSRYYTDEKYREAIIFNAKLRAKLKKASIKLARVDKIRTVYGTEENPLSLRTVSRIVGIDYCNLRKWRNQGILPKPLYYKKSRAVYTESQAKYIRDFIEEIKMDRLYLTYVDFKVFLKRVWAIPYKGKEFSRELIRNIFNEVSKYEEIKEEDGEIKEKNQ